LALVVEDDQLERRSVYDTCVLAHLDRRRVGSRDSPDLAIDPMVSSSVASVSDPRTSTAARTHHPPTT